jgi:predicted dehydrogenase
MRQFVGKKMQVGVVGLGKMGMLHASILHTLPQVQLVAFCDKSRLMRRLAKQTLKSTIVTDDIGKLSTLGLDVVYVTTPIPSHYPILKEILTTNIAPNVFVEKTLSASYAQSQELETLAKTKGVNMVGYMKRFSVTFKKAKTLLTQEKIGKLVSFDAYAYSSDFADVKEGSGTPNARGGVLEDLGSHVADLALWFFGELRVTQVNGASDPNSTINFQVNGPGGLEGSFDVSWVKPNYRMPEFGLKITGTQGIMTVTDTDLTVKSTTTQHEKWFRQNLNDNVDFLLGDPEYYREDKHFINCIFQKTKPDSTFETAAKVDKLLSEVQKTAGKHA